MTTSTATSTTASTTATSTTAMTTSTTTSTSSLLSPDISSALDELMLFLEPSKNRQNRSDVKFEAVKAVSKGMADR